MKIYTFTKGEMNLRIKVTDDDEPHFQTADVVSSVGGAKSMIESYLPKEEWMNYTHLIDAIDAVERGSVGVGRRRMNPIYRARVDKLRNWIEWEVIPQLTKLVMG